MSCFAPLKLWKRSRDYGDPSLPAETRESDCKPPAYTADAADVAPLDGTTAEEVSYKLEQLRREMRDSKVDAYLVPTADAHASEFVCECDKRRAWLTGFSGSAGTAVVTFDEAQLFTDSRYWIQAAKQIEPGWTMQRVGKPGVPDVNAYLSQLAAGTRIGVDPALISTSSAQEITRRLPDSSMLVYLADNLVDKIWTDRPRRPARPVNLHPLEFSGRDAADKLNALRDDLALVDDEVFVLSTLPQIAWLLNMRGGDIQNNPFFFSYVVVKEESFSLFVQKEAVTSAVKSEVARLGGYICEYDEVVDAIKGFKVFATPGVSVALTQQAESYKILDPCPVTAAQAIKNDVEIEGFRRAYARDAIAWSRWLSRLERDVQRGCKINEWDAGVRLTEERAKMAHFAGLAYDNISAVDANAALPHYEPTPTVHKALTTNSLYLNDSGAQYRDGTIDTTRTYHFGRPTAKQKRAYTLVLKGQIALDMAVWPEGTSPIALDALARQHLWQYGLNYNHGTGHGVGSYGGVHEIPPSIAQRVSPSSVPLAAGHVTSIEPGYYKEGEFGIRIENVVVVKLHHQDEDGLDWFCFERLSKVPIATNLVDWKMMTKEEKKWLEQHNADCRLL